MTFFKYKTTIPLPCLFHLLIIKDDIVSGHSDNGFRHVRDIIYYGNMKLIFSSDNLGSPKETYKSVNSDYLPLALEFSVSGQKSILLKT